MVEILDQFLVHNVQFFMDDSVQGSGKAQLMRLTLCEVPNHGWLKLFAVEMSSVLSSFYKMVVVLLEIENVFPRWVTCRICQK